MRTSGSARCGSNVASRAVTGLTFVAIGVLLVLDAAAALELPAAVVPALLLLGLGVSLLAGARSPR